MSCYNFLGGGDKVLFGEAEQAFLFSHLLLACKMSIQQCTQPLDKNDVEDERFGFYHCWRKYVVYLEDE